MDLVLSTDPVMLSRDELPELSERLHRSGSDMDIGLPAWWGAAVHLFIIADEASRGIGFMPVDDAKLDWIRSFQEKQYEGYNSRSIFYNRFTIKSDPEFGAVLPKTRTPQVGCTLRALSHHVAIIPPEGQIGVKWYSSRSRPRSEDTHLNLLLVPFLYDVTASCFSTSLPNGGTNGQSAEFEIDQKWLGNAERKECVDGWLFNRGKSEAIVDFITDLVQKSINANMNIHGVILPELSLDYMTFNFLAYQLKKKFSSKGFNFIVCGTSERIERPSEDALLCKNAEVPKFGLKSGNYVSVRGVIDADWAEPDESKIAWDFASDRGKHHRWKLDEFQIEKYALTRSLLGQGRDRSKSPSYFWEKIDIGHRRLDAFEIRGGSVMMPLICEDLARVDPVQEVVRALGPNLLIALLMDGPQTKFRWAAHYAGVLAEDPGCSVLTLTSYGMVRRAAAIDLENARNVAYWRDARGQAKHLSLPAGMHGLVVQLKGKSTTDHAMDGRDDFNLAYDWCLADVETIRGNPGLAESAGVPAIF
ncbi:MAG: hypothetical protein ACFB2Z_04765 [Maricaulaceae bacterium]